MKKLIKKILKEQSYINQHGGLHDFSFGVYYPFDEMSPMIQWFLGEYGEQIQVQGWTIFDSAASYPLKKYDNKGKSFWMVERIDDVDSWYMVLWKVLGIITMLKIITRKLYNKIV